jgi:AraC-like DNA-binding protein
MLPQMIVSDPRNVTDDPAFVLPGMGQGRPVDLSHMLTPSDSESPHLRRIVEHLMRSIVSFQIDDPEMAGGHLLKAAALLGVELTEIPHERKFSEQNAVREVHGGLAPWQIHRVRSHIESRLGHEPLLTKDLAALTGLNQYHFCRVFRRSFGETPHGFIVRRRIEKAQGLMLKDDTALSRIASECGFADQAHFSRTFRKRLGVSPGEWRRARFAGHP